MLKKRRRRKRSYPSLLFRSVVFCNCRYMTICSSHVCWPRIYCSHSQSSTTSVHGNGNPPFQVLLCGFHQYRQPASRHPSFLNSTHQLKEKTCNRCGRQAGLVPSSRWFKCPLCSRQRPLSALSKALKGPTAHTGRGKLLSISDLGGGQALLHRCQSHAPSQNCLPFHANRIHHCFAPSCAQGTYFFEQLKYWILSSI